METGNLNEKIKERIFNWLAFENIQSGSCQITSKELLNIFKIWLAKEGLSPDALTQKLFTQTVMTKIHFKRVGSGTAFLTNKMKEAPCETA